MLFFDPNHRHRRYNRPPVDILRDVLQTTHLMHTEGLVRAVQRRLHDIFCSTWIVWWLCVIWRSRKRPLFARRPTVVDVIRFLQHAAKIEKDDFLQYLQEEHLQNHAQPEEEARRIWFLLQTTSPRAFIHAFYGIKERRRGRST